MPTFALANDFPDIAKILELFGATGHLEFYSARPRAIEIATRSALETLLVQLERPPELRNPENLEEIWTAVHLRAEILECLLSVEGSPIRAVEEIIFERIECKSGASASESPEPWLDVLKLFETNPPETRRLLKVAYSASLNSCARNRAPEQRTLRQAKIMTPLKRRSLAKC